MSAWIEIYARTYPAVSYKKLCIILLVLQASRKFSLKDFFQASGATPLWNIDDGTDRGFSSQWHVLIEARERCGTSLRFN